MKLKDAARIAKAFKLEIGGLRAQGAPAVIVALGGLALAAGTVRLLAQNAGMLPETLREAKGLVQALRSPAEPKRLNS